MISAQQLYQKIKAKYPDFRPPKAAPNDFRTHPTGPIDEDQIRLMEAGFPVNPGYDPRAYPDSNMDPEVINRIINKLK